VTTVVLHRLAVRTDRDSVIVGRRGSNTFVSIPFVGLDAIRLLEDGNDIETVTAVLSDRYATDVDVAQFVESLTALGFVRRVGDTEVPDPGVPPVTWPRLRRRHVWWLQTTAARMVVVATVLAGLCCVIADPAARPHRADLLWSTHPSLLVTATAAITWAMIGLHELAHLFTARAAGVPGRISLGTRLQFLVAQTDVTGVWTAPTSQRHTVYLAGMALDLSIAAVAAITRATGVSSPVLDGLLATVIAVAVTKVGYQLLVFMRTDVYFALQDATRARDLFGDGRAYVTWLVRRLVPGRRTGAGPDPTRRLPPAEKRTVRVYAGVLGAGTTVCLTTGVLITLPWATGVAGRCLTTIVEARGLVGVVDGAAPFLAFTLTQTLFWRSWLQNRRRRHA
jgi:putative peptide zinc metalloprotease protein